VVEEENKSTKVAAPSSNWPHWLRFGRFSWLDLVVFGVAEGVAVPLCIAGGDAFVRRDWAGAAIGWGLGLPLILFGIAFPLSKYWFRPRTIIRIQRSAIMWAPALIIAAFAYLVGPFIYYRFQSPPSAEEIAQAIIRALPRQQITAASPPSQPAASQPSTPYVNPLHDWLSKWQIVLGIRMAILHSGLSANCQITIVRYPETYAEDYAADFKQILDVIGWKYDEHFAQGTLQKELTIHAVVAPGPSNECASALSERLNNADMRTCKGNPPNIVVFNLLESKAPSYLRNCPDGCIEVDFGNEDTSR
jgi:hypothetical protein